MNARVHPFKDEEAPVLPKAPVPRQGEFLAVETGGVLSELLLRDLIPRSRRTSEPGIAVGDDTISGSSSEWRVEYKGVRGVGVDGHIEALQLPVTRQPHEMSVCPRRRGVLETDGTELGGSEQCELPDLLRALGLARVTGQVEDVHQVMSSGDSSTHLPILQRRSPLLT